MMIGITTINSLSQFTTMLSPRLLRQLLKESHHATLLCAQTNATFNSLCQNPVEKLVCLSWDSTDLPICHSSNQALQKRTFSRKSNSHALHRLVSSHDKLLLFIAMS